MEVRLWSKQALEDVLKAREAALLDIGSSIIAETPIDTGLCRGNWQSSLGTPKEDELPLRPSVGAVAELADTVASMKGDETFVMRNNLVYATALEFGHSKQAPAGMVRKNVERWQSAVDKAAKNKRLATVSNLTSVWGKAGWSTPSARGRE